MVCLECMPVKWYGVAYKQKVVWQCHTSHTASATLGLCNHVGKIHQNVIMLMTYCLAASY